MLQALLTIPLIALPQNPPAAESQNANAERIESGTLNSPEGKAIAWRIRLLPISSFPELPSAVASELNRRQCMIPQSFEARQPENVIHGAFRTAGSSDWAALCSAQQVTTLYVFFDGQLDTPTALRSQPDSAWLGAEPGESVFSSAWGIAVRSASELRASPQLRHSFAIEHDAIDDARLERSITVRYFQNGQWTILNRKDAGD